MEKSIKITKKNAVKGDDGHKVISVRMKDETLNKLDDLVMKTNRSRNELVNLLVEKAMEIVEIEE
ncbi:MAG: CopG family transcriptional regulator [Clostridia bacterium]|nr:CopG family transcriptional regulator [Clostridia bacterium]MBQ7102041.1 CopG family transcriptional regulator [Clostridia bacterium]